MKLRRYAGTGGSVLILDTGGGLPDRQEWQLMCCRSLTLPVDALLLGPLSREQPFRVMVLDPDGMTMDLGWREAAAFGAFLQDEGYARGLVCVTDGARTYRIPAGHSGWWAVTAPEGLRLQRLLSL